MDDLLGHLNGFHYSVLVPVHLVEGAQSVLALRNHEGALPAVTLASLVREPACLIVEGGLIAVNPLLACLTLLEQVTDDSSSLVLGLGESAVESFLVVVQLGLHVHECVRVRLLPFGQEVSWAHRVGGDHLLAAGAVDCVGIDRVGYRVTDVVAVYV